MKNFPETLMDETISLDQVIESLKNDRQEMGELIEESITSLKTLTSYNSRAIVFNELIDVLLDSDMIYIAKSFGDEALACTSQIENRVEKAKTLSRLSNTFHRHGFHQLSQEIFESVLKEIEDLDDSHRLVNLLISLIEEQLDDDLIDRGRETLDRTLPIALNLAEDSDILVPLALLTDMKARIGDENAEAIAEKTLSLSKKIDRDDEDGWVDCSLIKAFIRLDRYETAEELLKQLENKGCSDLHLMEIGIVLSEKKLFEKALDLTSKMQDDHFRFPLMRVLACDLIFEDLTEDAMKLAEDIEDDFERDLVYKELVEKSLDEENFDDAYRYLQMIENSYIDALTQKQIGLKYHKKGRQKKAIDHLLEAGQIASEIDKDSIKLEIVEGLMELGMDDRATKIVETIETIEEKTISLVIIAAKKN